MSNMNSKNHLKNGTKINQRASMDSDTSGYSSISTNSRKSNGSFFNDHNYTIIKVPPAVPSPVDKQLKRNNSIPSQYNDHVVTLKESSEQEPLIVDAKPTNLHINGIKYEETETNNEEVRKISNFSPIKTRRKSMLLEQEERMKTAPRRSRRLSTYLDVRKEESPKPSGSVSKARRKSCDVKEREIFQFPKISNTKDYVTELKSSPTKSPGLLKTRRKSHGGVDNMTPITSIDRKIITRRRSVYVAHNVEIAKPRTRRQSTFVAGEENEVTVKRPRRSSIYKPQEDNKETIKRPRRQSTYVSVEDSIVTLKENGEGIKRQRRQSTYVEIKELIKRPRRQSTYVAHDEPPKRQRRPSVKPTDKRSRNKAIRRARKEPPTEDLLENELAVAQEIEEDVIEDVWFVSLVTIERESQMQFLVKWDGHPPTANTYEPFEHIKHCDVLQEYVDRKFIQHSEQIEKIREQLLSDIQEKFDSYSNRSKASIVKKFCDFSELEFKCSLLAYIFTYGGEVIAPFMKRLRYNNLIYHFYEQWKKEQDSNFMLLETIMSEENYSFVLTAENSIDYEPVPKFEYLAKVKYPITSFNFGLNAGCKCGSTCNSYTNCCPQNLGWNFVYNESDLKLNTKEIQMIVECNDFCSCDKDCPNRPKEITVKLVIFKTHNRGWSVKTLDHIPAGKFIIEYTGEFIDQVESRKRARKYGKMAHTYLFDLDYINKGLTPYSIDATHAGNIARFINHSCNPNLNTWPAITCNQDPRMHKLYYFSQRYIRPGEELTVDYTGGRKQIPKDKEYGDKFKCFCGSSACKGYIF